MVRFSRSSMKTDNGQNTASARFALNQKIVRVRPRSQQKTVRPPVTVFFYKYISTISLKINEIKNKAFFKNSSKKCEKKIIRVAGRRPKSQNKK